MEPLADGKADVTMNDTSSNGDEKDVAISYTLGAGERESGLVDTLTCGMAGICEKGISISDTLGGIEGNPQYGHPCGMAGRWMCQAKRNARSTVKWHLSWGSWMVDKKRKACHCVFNKFSIPEKTAEQFLFALSRNEKGEYDRA